MPERHGRFVDRGGGRRLRRRAGRSRRSGFGRADRVRRSGDGRRGDGPAEARRAATLRRRAAAVHGRSGEIGPSGPPQRRQRGGGPLGHCPYHRRPGSRRTHQWQVLGRPVVGRVRGSVPESGRSDAGSALSSPPGDPFAASSAFAIEPLCTATRCGHHSRARSTRSRPDHGCPTHLPRRRRHVTAPAATPVRTHRTRPPGRSFGPNRTASAPNDSTGLTDSGVGRMASHGCDGRSDVQRTAVSIDARSHITANAVDGGSNHARLMTILSMLGACPFWLLIVMVCVPGERERAGSARLAQQFELPVKLWVIGSAPENAISADRVGSPSRWT